MVHVDRRLPVLSRELEDRLAAEDALLVRKGDREAILPPALVDVEAKGLPDGARLGPQLREVAREVLVLRLVGRVRRVLAHRIPGGQREDGRFGDEARNRASGSVGLWRHVEHAFVRGERFAARHVNPTVDRRRPHVIQLLVGGRSARRNGGAPRGVDDCRATAQRRAAEERSTARRCAKDERAEEGCHIVRLSEVIERSRASARRKRSRRVRAIYVRALPKGDHGEHLDALIRPPRGAFTQHDDGRHRVGGADDAFAAAIPAGNIASVQNNCMRGAGDAICGRRALACVCFADCARKPW